MKMNADEKNCFPIETSSDGKDRRRFLKKMAVCAVAAPLLTVLPPISAALASGFNSNDVKHHDLKDIKVKKVKKHKKD
jgi:hypothetical protein